MSFEVSQKKDWTVFSVEDRLDAFNGESFKAKMDKVMKKKASNVALELTNAQFISLPMIKYFSGVADQINEKGGKFALVGTPEKLKRQIDIFASLKPMLVFRSEEDWVEKEHLK